tara:strand:- start:6326 stop:6670 length:345 start_codon:yes stop_codon:yes gene_type:complete
MEEILNREARKLMKDWDVDKFKKTYPSLFNVIMAAMKVAASVPQIGAKIIWDSGNGWEKGTYKNGKSNVYNCSLVELETGSIKGIVSLPDNEIHIWSDELEFEMFQRYDIIAKL